MVNLIQRSSWDGVLSDLWTGAREPAGFLGPILVGWAAADRAGSGALRPEPILIGRELFTTSTAFAAKLFTIGAGDVEGFRAAFPRRL